LDGSSSDFQAVQETVTLSGRDRSILWSTADAPLVCIGGMFSMRWAGRDTRPEHPHLFSYAMHNTWMTNCPLWQGGTIPFRYALTSRRKAPTAAEAVEFGRSFAEPLSAVFNPSTRPARSDAIVPGQPRLKLPADRLSLEAMEKSADGRSIRILLAEQAGQSGLCRIELPFAIRQAHRLNLCGDRMEACRIRSSNRIELAIGPRELILINAEIQ
jgi:hypothetical protein